MSAVPAGYKQTEVGVIPENWEVATLQKICAATITYGIVQCGPHIANGIPYIRVSDMNGPSLDVSSMLRTSQAIASQFSRSQVDEGDVVYALRGKIGEVRIVDETVSGANLTQGTARL
jgi:type I restriction enzyme, S subunit